MMRLSLLTPADYRGVPWRNGVGSTTEIAVWPETNTGVGGDFVWRVSIADVRGDGPFSPFAGYDRTLMLVDGDGMVLRHEAHGEQRLDQPFRPVCFPGDWTTSGILTGGPTRNLNVITQRARARHAVTAVEGWATLAHAMTSTAGAAVLLCLRGSADGDAGGRQPFVLNAGETAILAVDGTDVESTTDLVAAGRTDGTVLVLCDIALTL
jgi:uncharacterized protein